MSRGIKIRMVRYLARFLLVCAPLALIGQIGDAYADALRYFDLGRYERARNRLEAMLTRDYQCIECYELLARIAMAVQQDSLAAEWYRQALEVEPENPNLLLQLGLAEHRLGQLQPAMSRIRASLEINPTSGESHFSLGNALFDMDSLAQAENSYLAALALDSTVAKYHYQLAGIYLRTDRSDSALVEYQHAYHLYPKYSMAYEEAAGILRQQQRWSDMALVLEEGLSQASETRNTRYWLGNAYVEIEDYQRAAEILGGIVKRQDKHLGARFKYGVALYHIGEYEQAIEHLLVVTSQMASLLEAQLYLGMSYNAIDLDSAALVIFDSLLLAVPDYYDAWIRKGDLHLKRERYPMAQRHYDIAADINPGRWESFHRQALIHYYQSEYPQAELLLYQAYLRNDSASVIQAALGDVAAGMGEDDFAIYYYGKLVAADPDDSAVRRQLAGALARRKLYRLARQELNWILRQDSRNEQILYQMGQLSYAASDTTAGKHYLERYLRIHQARRQEERLGLRIAAEPFNPLPYRLLGEFHLRQEHSALARDAFRKAVALGDTTLDVSDYLEEGVGP